MRALLLLLLATPLAAQIPHVGSGITTQAGSVSGATTPATTALLKGGGTANSVTTAVAGTDYALPATVTAAQNAANAAQTTANSAMPATSLSPVVYSSSVSYGIGVPVQDASGNNWVSLVAANQGNTLVEGTYWHFLGGKSATVSAGDCPAGSGMTGLASQGFSGTKCATFTSVTSAAPYLKIGSSLYIPRDNMYLATVPSFTTWAALNTCGIQGSVAGANGNVDLYQQSCYGFYAAPSAKTSIELASDCSTNVDSYAPTCGMWFYDSTNGKLQTFTWQGGNLLQQVWTYTPGSEPGYSSKNTATTYSGPLFHLRGAVSGTTLTFSYSQDGGATYVNFPAVTVGTVSRSGLFVAGHMNVSSLVVN